MASNYDPDLSAINSDSDDGILDGVEDRTEMVSLMPKKVTPLDGFDGDGG